ncbi:hypothetical protein GCM10017608_31010 [Agromyces luteolus]|uniref:DUF2238 domain-containing protein n=1 Tax=Agromyces luteolus TaxID=88373 RepID=A0A7C9LID2_9MICO|nr:hypothetical protein [Agromyces luteolus]MUN07814.1 hypothetical protein [Agromyces luteolus]GLK29165.1 hypothetical protein GCM10017608_31010 [Agromyces luteolus]
MRSIWSGLTRRAEGPGEIAADVLRLIALVCIPIAGIGWGPLGLVSLAFVSAAMVIPRLLHVRPALDLSFGVIALVSVWSSVTDLYVSVRWWDIPMHFLMNGLAAVIAVLLFARLRLIADPQRLPRPVLAAVLVTTAFGLGLAVIWEVFEWFGKNFIDDEIYVDYRDTIGDLVWGGLGSALGGLALPVLAPKPERAAVGNS